MEINNNRPIRMRYLVILFTLFSFSTFGQVTFSQLYSKMRVVADTSVAMPAGYGGIRYNNFRSPHSWQYNNGSGWINFGAGGSGGISSCKPAGNEYTTAHTLVIGDVNLCNNMGVIRMNATSAVNVTVPLNSSVAFEKWTQIGIDNQGTDTVSVVFTGGVIGHPSSLKIGPGGFSLILKTDTNVWDIGGGGGTGGGMTLTDGSATTVNGTGVDLGGVATGPISIDLNGNGIDFSNGPLVLNGDLSVDAGAGSINLTSVGGTSVGYDNGTSYNGMGYGGGGSEFVAINSVSGVETRISATTDSLNIQTTNGKFIVKTGNGSTTTPRILIDKDGSWDIGAGHLPGTAGQTLTSNGSSGPPTWKVPVYSNNFSQVGAATTVFTVTIGTTQANNTYEVTVTPTSALSAALFYVTNKTTTTFDVTYLAGLTGTVTFDWILRP